MIEVSDEFQQAWLNGRQKYIQLNFSDGTSLAEDGIVAESFVMKQSLCEEPQLQFGLTSSTEVSIKLFNTGKQYKGLSMEIIMGAVDEDDHYYTMSLGTYKIENDVRSDDRHYRTITAYDALYDVLNTNYADWYTSLANMSWLSLEDFRHLFFSHIGISERSAVLPHETYRININPNVKTITGREIIQGICETAGCFGFIDYEGYFRYVTPAIGKNGYYPANDLYPSDDIYPGEGADIIVRDDDDEGAPVLGSLKYEDYYTHRITGAMFMPSENLSGGSAGTTENMYVFRDSIVWYKKPIYELEDIAQEFLDAVGKMFYHPGTVKARARIWAQPGDLVAVRSEQGYVLMPILERTMEGITALYDTYTAKGTEYFNYNANTLVQRLTNDEARIEQSEQKIELKVSKGNVSSELSIEPDQISIRGNRLLIDSTNFTLDYNGHMTCYGASIKSMYGSGDSYGLEISNGGIIGYDSRGTQSSLFDFSAITSIYDTRGRHVKDVWGARLSAGYIFLDSEYLAVPSDTSQYDSTYAPPSVSHQFLDTMSFDATFTRTEDFVHDLSFTSTYIDGVYVLTGASWQHTWFEYVSRWDYSYTNKNLKFLNGIQVNDL